MDRLITSIKLGASISRFRVDSYLRAPGPDQEHDSSKTVVGFFTSLNLEYALTEGWSALTSISYGIDCFSRGLASAFGGVDPGEFRSLKVDLSNYAIKAGLVYRFNLSNRP